MTIYDDHCEGYEVVVNIWSGSYSPEKNLGPGGSVISFTNQVRTCTDIVHVISRLIGIISRLGLRLVD